LERIRALRRNSGCSSRVYSFWTENISGAPLSSSTDETRHCTVCADFSNRVETRSRSPLLVVNRILLSRSSSRSSRSCTLMCSGLLFCFGFAEHWCESTPLCCARAITNSTCASHCAGASFSMSWYDGA